MPAMIDVVCISQNSRPLLFQQTMLTLHNNANDPSNYKLTVVFNGDIENPPIYEDVTIICGQIGASDSRNCGASSIPRYRRRKYLLFLDDDVWLSPGYDDALLAMAEALPRHLISLYGHPFNHEEDRGSMIAKFPLLISSVCVFMTWDAWDEIGYWDLPGGPGASEDYAYCQRAKRLGYEFAVSNPHKIIHCGLVSSRGDRIVGYSALKDQNERLLKRYGMTGKVIVNE